MKRIGLFLMVICSLGISGCQEKKANDIVVVFEQRPPLLTDKVYCSGVEIGAIRSLKVGFDGISEMALAVMPAHLPKIADDTVFYPEQGALVCRSLGGAGKPVKPGETMLGFGSKAALNWFRFSNLLGNPAMDAAARARTLSEKIKWAEMREVPLKN